MTLTTALLIIGSMEVEPNYARVCLQIPSGGCLMGKAPRPTAAKPDNGEVRVSEHPKGTQPGVGEQKASSLPARDFVNHEAKGDKEAVK